jgi:hypothetical protein
MNSELITIGTTTANAPLPARQPLRRQRYTVVSRRPTCQNTAYTGYSATASYLLAAPSRPARHRGRVPRRRSKPRRSIQEPADFNQLGIQMRGAITASASRSRSAGAASAWLARDPGLPRAWRAPDPGLQAVPARPPEMEDWFIYKGLKIFRRVHRRPSPMRLLILPQAWPKPLPDYREGDVRDVETDVADEPHARSRPRRRPRTTTSRRWTRRPASGRASTRSPPATPVDARGHGRPERRHPRRGDEAAASITQEARTAAPGEVMRWADKAYADAVGVLLGLVLGAVIFALVVLLVPVGH